MVANVYHVRLIEQPQPEFDFCRMNKALRYNSILRVLRPSTFHILARLLVVEVTEAQTPIALVPEISVSPATLAVDAVRMAYDSHSGKLVLLSMNGNISTVDVSSGNGRVNVIQTFADHGLRPPALGIAVAPDGTLFIVGNNSSSTPGYNIGVVKRGKPSGTGGYTWETVFETVPYPRSGTNYDHNMNGIVISPDGSTLYVNSGSRTDHGEVQDGNGAFPGLREVPLTSAILKIPAVSTDLLLQNDFLFLEQNGFLFADGVRNSFSLAFDPEGRLYGTENSGDRDDNEELNILIEGAHYGFPWRMGQTNTPMQFAGYQPGSDLLLNPQAGAVQGGEFYDDPSFPSPPIGVRFTDPVKNLGPDADLYRDPITGQIRDATGNVGGISTFTSHRSPLGLVFDRDRILTGNYVGDGFVLSWTGPESPLLAPFTGEGEDLIHLDFVEGSDGKVLHARKIAAQFLNPIDAALIGNQLFILEFGNGGRIWKVEFASTVAKENELIPAPIKVELYPNPASGTLRFSVITERPEMLHINLVGLSGRRIDSIYRGVAPAGRLEISDYMVGGLPAGVYLLEINGQYSGQFIQKVVLL